MPRFSMMASLPPRRYASQCSHVALISSICESSNFSLEENCDTLMEDDVDSKFAANGSSSTIEYKDKVEGFSQIVLEYNGCARLTIDNIAILSPNHRPKPPPSTLTLTENHSGSKP
jgi:hypothetical protein